MFSEFDVYIIRGAGVLALAWAGWVTKELISLGKSVAVIRDRLVGEIP